MPDPRALALSFIAMLPRWLRQSRSYLSRHFGRPVAEPWFVDLVNVESSAVTVDGWSFPRAEPSHFFLNGERFDTIDYPLLRADVGRFFWQRENAEMCGFHCRSTAVRQAYPDGVMKISRSGDASLIDSGRNAWYIPEQRAHANVPDGDRRFRVIGDRDLAGFLNTGATDFHRLSEVSQKLAGRPLWAFDSVLDWGVGCGRLARHFPRQFAQALTGCDIDRDNVEWCEANLAGRFVTSSLVPPLPFADDAFDVVYGVSVFTHMREALQDAWLAELRRVVKVGGLVLTTAHGETAVGFLRLPPREHAELNNAIARQGLLVSGANAQLDGHVQSPHEYVNVYHDRRYVKRHWSRYFDVLHVIPGYIFTHDLVVMRRRS